MRNAMDSLTVDDMPSEELRWVAAVFGVEVAVRLWKKFRGNALRFPSRMPREQVLDYMRDNFDKPVHSIAVAVGLSPRTIQRYMNHRPSKDPKQTSFF